MKTSPIILLAALALFPLVSKADDEAKPVTPKDYAALHNLVSNPQDPKWPDSMQQASKSGDAFTVEHLKRLDAQKLDIQQAAILKDTISAIQDRASKEDDKTFVKLIEVRLERAAWVDLRCDRLEVTLVPWTHRFIREHLKTPGTVAELERIQSQYSPANAEKTPFGSTQARVRVYASRLLNKPDEPVEVQTR